MRGRATVSAIGAWHSRLSEKDGATPHPTRLRRATFSRKGRRVSASLVMPFPDITSDIRAAAPELRGRLLANQEMAGLTWFRVGGPAQLLFTPADEEDLAYFLARLPAEIPVTVVGLGSNLIVRDGGI